jgi:Tfp pilus assembly protein PilF
LADYYVAAPDYEPIPENQAAPKAKAAAEKALSIDNSSAEAHAALAAANWSLFDFAGAEVEFRRALELNSNLPNAHHWYGLFLSWESRHAEALPHLRPAVELDPLNLQYNTNLGQIFCNARQYEECIDQLKKTLEMDANFAYAHNMLRVAYRDTGKYDLSLEEWKKSATLANDQDELAIADDLAQVYARSGVKASEEREIELKKQLAKRRYLDPAEIAYDYAELGNKEQTFAWLDKARAEKSGALENIKSSTH